MSGRLIIARPIFDSGQGLCGMSDKALAAWLEAFNNPSESVLERRARLKREKETNPKETNE